MKDAIADMTPGEFDSTQTAEIILVIVGAWQIIEGNIELGLACIGVAVGGENVGELLKSTDTDLQDHDQEHES